MLYHLPRVLDGVNIKALFITQTKFSLFNMGGLIEISHDISESVVALLSHSLCRIEGYSSGPNTKVCGDGHTLFKHFSPSGWAGLETMLKAQ